MAMGFAPKKKRDFDWGAAALSFLGGPEVASTFIKRRDAEETRERALEQEMAVRTALAKRGYTEDDINVLITDPKAAAGLIQEALKPRQFDSGGGSIYNPTAAPDQQWTSAPSERQIGRSIIRTDPTGNARTVFEGVEPVAVEPGGQVYGWGSRGPVAAPSFSRSGVQPGPYETPIRGDGRGAGPVSGWDPNSFGTDDEWEYIPPVTPGGAPLAGARPFRRSLWGR